MPNQKNDPNTIVKKMVSMGEERLAEVMDELLSNDRVSGVLATAMSRTQTLKASLDKNVGLALSLVNQPTRQDFDKLRKQVRSLERQIEDLSDKVDALAKPKPAPRKSTAGKSTTQKKSAARRS